MRIFKNKWFAKFADKEGISDEGLLKAIKDIEAGNTDADLGGGVIKQRVARFSEGKSGGYRTIILYRRGDLAFFVYGFAKNILDNIDRADLRDFKKLAKIMLALSDEQLKMLLESKELREIKQ